MKTVPSLMVIDDNPGDVELCRLVFGRTGQYPYIFATDNAEKAVAMLLDYEKARLEHPDRFPPTLMLLDINMPGMDGFAFLEAYAPIRAQLEARGMPTSMVVMLTSSADPRDVKRAEQSDLVVEYLQKPPTKADAQRLAERFGSAA